MALAWDPIRVTHDKEALLLVVWFRHHFHLPPRARLPMPICHNSIVSRPLVL
ncbi:hypothetical protein ES702_01582 [subsurface metagenome]